EQRSGPLRARKSLALTDAEHDDLRLQRQDRVEIGDIELVDGSRPPVGHDLGSGYEATVREHGFADAYLASGVAAYGVDPRGAFVSEFHAQTIAHSPGDASASTMRACPKCPLPRWC